MGKKTAITAREEEQVKDLVNIPNLFYVRDVYS